MIVLIREVIFHLMIFVTSSLHYDSVFSLRRRVIILVLCCVMLIYLYAVGSALEQMHIFALAHILRRPIIVYGVKYVKSFRGETIDLAKFQGNCIICS